MRRYADFAATAVTFWACAGMFALIAAVAIAGAESWIVVATAAVFFGPFILGVGVLLAVLGWEILRDEWRAARRDQ